MNEVINQIGGFYKNSIYYGDTDSMYIHKEYCSDLVDNGFVGKSLGLGKNDYGSSGLSYAGFSAPKITYCLVIEDIGVLSARGIFEGYRKELRTLKLDEKISLSEGKTLSGRFSVDWTKTIEGTKIPHGKQDCLDCDNGNICSNCVRESQMNFSNSGTERACKTCLDLISQKKTYSIDINIFKRQPANEKYEKLPYYESEYKPKQNDIVFESARDIWMKEDYKMLMKRRFERIYNMTECKSYMKNEDLPENKKYFSLWIQTY